MRPCRTKDDSSHENAKTDVIAAILRHRAGKGGAFHRKGFPDYRFEARRTMLRA